MLAVDRFDKTVQLVDDLVSNVPAMMMHTVPQKRRSNTSTAVLDTRQRERSCLVVALGFLVGGR